VVGAVLWYSDPFVRVADPLMWVEALELVLDRCVQGPPFGGVQSKALFPMMALQMGSTSDGFLH
jgi:hypothetical protein